MATRQLLAELAQQYESTHNQPVRIESVGGVDATRRVVDGEPFDLVFLANNAIDKLIGQSVVQEGSRVDMARSTVAIAVAQGATPPPINNVPALQDALRNAAGVGYSPGPSGVAVRDLLEQWGLVDELGDRLVQSAPGVPVGQLLTEGKISIGFQQRSELMHLAGVQIIGSMPDEVAIETVFSGGVCATCTQPDKARALLHFLASREAHAALAANGMTPVS
jgi:molybdate transport system substrate-binding protein